jgi:hypothetical protein
MVVRMTQAKPKHYDLSMHWEVLVVRCYGGAYDTNQII